MKRGALLLLDAVLVVSAAIAVVVIGAAISEQRDAKRVDDVQTLLGVVSPRTKF